MTTIYIICFSILIFTVIICISSYLSENNKLKVEIVDLKEKIHSKNTIIDTKDYIIEITNHEKESLIKAKEKECDRLSSLLKESLEKTQRYSVDASLKM